MGFVWILWSGVTKGTCRNFGFLGFLKHGITGEVKLSRTKGVTGERVEKSGIGGRARTMAGAGPTDLLYGSRGVPAAYRHQGGLGPHEPCPRGPRVTIAEAREERRHLERRAGAEMEDIVTFCEGSCGKRCHLRVPAEESNEVTNCSSGSKTRRYRKRGSPKPSKGDAGKSRQAPSAGCSVLRRTPRDIILVTIRMMPAQIQISRRGGRILPQILNFLMMRNGNHCREGQPPPLSRGTQAMVRN